ncbi:hypothetical protein AGOR_G00131830 [Albula goreensis]|uniref:Death domain-containing protein n=1 Tax=Albula goreensis TaxID=1534307 RepID=A0A8T3D6G2_9TELE|nr:hypothetical protein AGOR_G00131830 [Albula goreensis]
MDLPLAERYSGTVDDGVSRGIDVMAETPGGAALLLRRLKPPLIDALGVDPDYVLQHADALCLLSMAEYRRIKTLGNPSETIRDLLDCVIQKEQDAKVFLDFLKKAEVKEIFPKLSAIFERVEHHQDNKGLSSSKRKSEEMMEVCIKKQKCEPGSKVVTEKQLMLVARGIGRHWKQLGRVALDIPTVKLEQIEEENPGTHVERVFAMLRMWLTRERRNATTAHLHALLSQDECAPPPESIDFLLDPD